MNLKVRHSLSPCYSSCCLIALFIGFLNSPSTYSSEIDSISVFDSITKEPINRCSLFLVTNSEEPKYLGKTGKDGNFTFPEEQDCESGMRLRIRSNSHKSGSLKDLNCDISTNTFLLTKHGLTRHGSDPGLLESISNWFGIHPPSPELFNIFSNTKTATESMDYQKIPLLLVEMAQRLEQGSQASLTTKDKELLDDMIFELNSNSYIYFARATDYSTPSESAVLNEYRLEPSPGFSRYINDFVEENNIKHATGDPLLGYNLASYLAGNDVSTFLYSDYLEASVDKSNTPPEIFEFDYNTGLFQASLPNKEDAELLRKLIEQAIIADGEKNFGESLYLYNEAAAIGRSQNQHQIAVESEVAAIQRAGELLNIDAPVSFDHLQGRPVMSNDMHKGLVDFQRDFFTDGITVFNEGQLDYATVSAIRGSSVR